MTDPSQTDNALPRHMPDVHWVLFSKHRTLQAASCLRSLIELSDVAAEDITVLYVDSASIDYAPLKETLPCRFVPQTHFYHDVVDILNRTSTPFLSFLVDDLIFRDRFSAAHISAILRRHPYLDSFSLRLGRNIHDGRPPTFEEIEHGILSWETTPGLGTSWNYFWELTGAIYRRATVLEYLRSCDPDRVTFPNPLESLYYEIVPNVLAASRGVLAALRHPKHMYWNLFRKTEMRKRIACYEQSLAFTQGVNLVADRAIAYDTYLAPEYLHELFLEGYRIDYDCLRAVSNTRPNAGRQYFRLVGPDGSRHPLSVF